MVSHQVAVQSQQRQQAARAAYLGVADIVVCMLSDPLVLQLGVSTSARSFLAASVNATLWRGAVSPVMHSLQPIGFTKLSQTSDSNECHSGVQIRSNSSATSGPLSDGS